MDISRVIVRIEQIAAVTIERGFLGARGRCRRGLFLALLWRLLESQYCVGEYCQRQLRLAVPLVVFDLQAP